MLAIHVALDPAGRVRVTVANAGAEPATLELASACATDFELVDARGAVVATADRLCAQLLTTRALGAGASFTEAHPLPADLPPGRYALRGVLLLATGRVASPVTHVTLPRAARDRDGIA